MIYIRNSCLYKEIYEYVLNMSQIKEIKAGKKPVVTKDENSQIKIGKQDRNIK